MYRSTIIFKTSATTTPPQLKIKGNILKNKDINSKSKFELFLDSIKMEFPQKVEPIPINASLQKKPENTLPMTNTHKENPILGGNSCVF
jgi:hypothetical protein